MSFGGMVFLGSIVVLVSYESAKKKKKKNAHQTRALDKGSHKNGWSKKNGQPRVFIDDGIRVASSG